MASRTPTAEKTEPTAAALNEAGAVERVFWRQTMNVGYQWEQKVPARVMRRTETKVKIVYLLRQTSESGPVASADTPEGWQIKETWVNAPNVTPRKTNDTHAAKAAYPKF